VPSHAYRQRARGAMDAGLRADGSDLFRRWRRA
jgi:hypothetical protein